jgi:hypothetical protein
VSAGAAGCDSLAPSGQSAIFRVGQESVNSFGGQSKSNGSGSPQAGALPDLREQLQDSAYIVDLRTWCPSRQSEGADGTCVWSE